MSGARDDRPGLKELLGWVRDGDTVVVAALDRLGRSLSGVLRTIKTLQQRGIVLNSLREGIDFGSATGRMMAAIFGAMAQHERELIRERASAAREAAIARGMRPGRQPKLTAEQLDGAQESERPASPSRPSCGHSHKLHVLRSTGSQRPRIADPVKERTLYILRPVGAAAIEMELVRASW